MIVQYPRKYTNSIIFNSNTFYLHCFKMIKKFSLKAKLSNAWLTILYITFCNQNITVAKKLEWLDGLVSYIQKNNNEYQVMLLFDENGGKEKLKEDLIVKMISEKLPAIKISFQDATIEKANDLSQLPSFYTPRITMYIIVYLSQNTRNMTQLINFVSLISEPRRRPRCVIFTLQEEERFEYFKLLKRMWSKQFLDVTILELMEIENTKKSVFLNLNQEVAIIHQFNPFTENYNRFEYSATISWFPEKIRNLHGRKLKVGVSHLPPGLFLETDNTGHVTNAYGKFIFLTQSISKAMNFKIEWVVLRKEEDRFRRNDCTKGYLPRFLYFLKQYKIDFIGREDVRIGSCDEKLHEWSKGTKELSLVLIVPVSSTATVPPSIEWKFYKAFILVSLLWLIWILIRKLPFVKIELSLLQMMAIFLSTPTSQEPRKLAERIIFGAMLLSCLMDSSYIYTAITDINLKEEPKFNMNTIDDVISSDLQIMMTSYYHASFDDVTEEKIRIVLKKSSVLNGFSPLCVNHLFKKKDNACVRRSDTAAWNVEQKKDNCGRPISKIITEPLKTTATGMMMAARSPYVGRFDEIILILVQSGVVEKWQKMKFNSSSFIVNEDEACTTKRGSESLLLLSQIKYVLLYGYVLAITIFVCELLCAYLRKKANKSNNQ